MPQRRPKVLIGASIPRSGHHYLQRILSRYFGQEMFYCEWYTPTNCCRSVPCVRHPERLVTYQKSHDFDFTSNPDVSEAMYLVQFRHPVPQAISERELSSRDALPTRSLNYRLTRDHYSWWLAGQASYYRRFHRKWLCNRPQNRTYLDYECLRLQPAATITPIIRWVSGSVDEGRLSTVISAVSALRSPDQTFKPRVIEASPHFDRELLAPFEAYVLHHCPTFDYKSVLHGSYEDDPLYGQILLQDEDEPLPPGEVDRLDAAARRCPEHPEILFRLAKRELQRENSAGAIRLLERSVATSPYFGPSYRLLIQTCKSAGRSIPASCKDSNALFACTDDPPTLIRIAVAMLAEGRLVNALTALSLAALLQPDNHRANHLLGATLGRLGRWKQARSYAQRAAEIQPNNKETAKLLAEIGKHVDSEAVKKMPQKVHPGAQPAMSIAPVR